MIGYADTMEAWRTSCPRLTIWEDALSDGLLERVAAPRLQEASVRVTDAGRAFVDASPGYAAGPGPRFHSC